MISLFEKKGAREMLGTDIGIDLGTSSILIYVAGQGIVLNEPSVVAVDIETDEIIAMGREAQRMLGRTSDRIQVSCPLSNGVISDFDLTEQMIVRFIKQVAGSAVIMPRVVVCIPEEITEVERMAVIDAVHSAGARKICLIEEPIAAAIGAGMDISGPHGYMVVDIGAGTTDMAVISLGGIAVGRSIKVAGNVFDEEIIKYVRKKYNILIGKRMAEDAKIAIGCVYPRENQENYRIKGRNALTGLPQAVEFSSDEMLEAMISPAMQIVKEVQGLLEETPPELMGDIYTDGMVLTGGCAQLYGFDILLAKKTKMPVHVAEEPLNCVAIGAGKSLKYIDLLEDNRGVGINPLLSQ